MALTFAACRLTTGVFSGNIWVQGPGRRIQGSGFRFQGSGFSGWGVIWDIGFRGYEKGFGIRSLGFRV